MPIQYYIEFIVYVNSDQFTDLHMYWNIPFLSRDLNKLLFSMDEKVNILNDLDLTFNLMIELEKNKLY